MTDPDWTPDEAYRILREVIDEFLAGKGNATLLQDWLLNTYGTPPDTPSGHRARELWRQVVVSVAVYLQCDMQRSMLEESLRELVDGFDQHECVAFTAVTRSRCFRDLLREQRIPSPLINLTARYERAVVNAIRMIQRTSRIGPTLPMRKAIVLCAEKLDSCMGCFDQRNIVRTLATG